MRKSVMAAAAVLLAMGCEQERPAEALAGGYLVGTWKLVNSQSKAADGGEARSAGHGFFDRIAFHEDYSCYGERSGAGGRRTFEGSWKASGADLVVDCGGRVVSGNYGADSQRLVFAAGYKEAGARINATYVMQRVEEMDPPPRAGEDDDADDDDGDDVDDGDDDDGTGAGQGAGDASADASGDEGGAGYDGENGAAGDQDLANDAAAVALDGMPDEPAASGSDIFLWKPVSESNGNAVNLFPAKYRLDRIDSVYIDGGSRDGETPRSIYWPDGHNGNRVHVRWAAPGSAYGDDFRVVLVLVTGRQVSWLVRDGGNRQEM
ncbi:MAG: hypothetical protein FJ225_07145 [Lentisphaerae bacterium]|nr:hypothetical protein [Lentisphaerota bacterium]